MNSLYFSTSSNEMNLVALSFVSNHRISYLTPGTHNTVHRTFFPIYPLVAANSFFTYFNKRNLRAPFGPPLFSIFPGPSFKLEDIFRVDLYSCCSVLFYSLHLHRRSSSYFVSLRSRVSLMGPMNRRSLHFDIKTRRIGIFSFGSCSCSSCR